MAWRDGTTTARTPGQLDTAAAVVGSGAALPGLPNASVYPAGALFVRTTDFTIWRTDGAAWTAAAAVPTSHAGSHAPGGTDELYTYSRGHRIATRMEALQRSKEVNTAALAVTSGTIGLIYFTAQAGELGPFTKMAIAKGGTAGTTPTVCRIGLYQIAGNGDGTLLARTANDATIEAATNGIPERVMDTTGGFPASFTLTAGQRYAGAYINVSGGAPNYIGLDPKLSQFSLSFAPKIVGLITGQADLLTSFTAGQVSGGSANFGHYFHMAA